MKDDERDAPQLPSRPSSGNETSPELRDNPHRDDKKPGRDPPEETAYSQETPPALQRASSLLTGEVQSSPSHREHADKRSTTLPPAGCRYPWRAVKNKMAAPETAGAPRGPVGNVGAQWRREGASSLRLSESGGQLRGRQRAGEKGSSPAHGLGGAPRDRPGKAAAAVREAVRSSRRRLHSQCQDGRVV